MPSGQKSTAKRIKDKGRNWKLNIVVLKLNIVPLKLW